MALELSVSDTDVPPVALSLSSVISYLSPVIKGLLPVIETASSHGQSLVAVPSVPGGHLLPCLSLPARYAGRYVCAQCGADRWCSRPVH